MHLMLAKKLMWHCN